jgi:hypothetical protein
MIGTRAWIHKSSGDLSGLDRFRLLSRIAFLRMKGRIRQPTVSTGLTDELIAQMPDSKLVKLASEECLECCSTAIYHHSCRTYIWAAAIAKIDAVDYDPEELAVASLLHDLELGKVSNRAGIGCNCFAGAGAVTVDSWLQSQKVTATTRAAIAEAIALHLNPGVPLSLGATPHLLNIGAMADVVGSRMATISKGQRETTLASHPRCGFKTEMKGHMLAESLAAPRTRAGFLMSIGFANLIDNAPFDD